MNVYEWIDRFIHYYLTQRESLAVYGIDKTHSISFAHQNAKRSDGHRKPSVCSTTVSRVAHRREPLLSPD